ncbi:MAG: type VI secretion system baseplate subunit TssE [Gammaproteobacteria bacterium HGW-Gammaproteobacteria-1]|jgi:type VI secretion system protein ImpF|nr:MAG: type VI secretion system baseplate subunit TssE [Gammaproteobacteria bacterium HGW-Gammaproteobacteria-1]
MARVDKKKKLRPSLLDRLIDNEPHSQSEIDQGHHQLLRQMRDSVRRDLETLLNTRYHIIAPPEEYAELEKSLLNYGLPDLATVNIIDKKRRDEFTTRLETTLSDFEPRFKSVRVSYVDNKDSTDRTLRFRIDAEIYADPLPETVVFDSILESVTRTVSVKEISHG